MSELEFSKKKLKELISFHHPELEARAIERVLKFYSLVCLENEIQNLTKLTQPEDFYWGHLRDVMEFLKISFDPGILVDLGSGVGVPGLLSALLREDTWILCESEGRKADFLTKCVDTLSLNSHVRVLRGRAEETLKNQSFSTVAARAVGSVEKLFDLLKGCSTWNKLVLFKGPGWAEEWARYLQSKQKKKLETVSSVTYRVGPEAKKREIIVIRRTISH